MKYKERVKYSGSPTILFGLDVPYRKNRNHRWAEAIHKEMKGLQDHKTFSFLNSGEAAPTGYQFAPLRMIFTCREARSQVQGQVGDWRSCH